MTKLNIRNKHERRYVSDATRSLIMGVLLLGATFDAAAASQTGLTGIDPSETVILQWNDAALQAVRTTRMGPPIVARALAVLNTCTYDAWAAYDLKARGTRYGSGLRAPRESRSAAHKQQAVAYAGYRAALDLFPTQKLGFDSLLVAQGYDPANASTDRRTPAGIGNVACAAVLEFRHADKANQLGDLNPGAYSDWTGYNPINTPDQIVDPNRWQPLRIPNGQGGFNIQKFLAPHWGRVTPYAVGDWKRQVLEPVRRELRRRNGRVGPADVNDPDYRQQALEIISHSAILGDHEKMIAEYWAEGPALETPPGHWNLLAQTVSRRDHHSLDDDVKMMFAVSNAVFDISIVIWGAKVAFDYVRPVTAIRYLFRGQVINAWAGPGLGTQAIMGDTWQPYQSPTLVTPPFAEYPSGHSAFSAASAETLKRFTGSDVFGASVTLPIGTSFVERGIVPNHEVTLSWATFTDAAEQAAASRRYGGIHFLDGDLDARLMGRRTADIAWSKTQRLFGGQDEKNDGAEYPK
jgi:hypothetical protein